jgi:hypothetical protein
MLRTAPHPKESTISAARVTGPYFTENGKCSGSPLIRSKQQQKNIAENLVQS